MIPGIAAILLGAGVGGLAVLFAAPRGYLGHRKTKASATAPSPMSYAPTTEQAPEVPAAAAPAVAEPAPSPAPAPALALYETVQPPPAPVTYSAPPTASFGAPTFAKKPTRTYRRRTAPVRSAAGSKKSLAAKHKKR